MLRFCIFAVSAFCSFAYPTTLAHLSLGLSRGVRHTTRADEMYLSLWKQSNVSLRFSLVISCFATLALAQNLAFLSPDLTPVVSGGALPHYTVGDYVGVSWTTPFEETNLLVYQLKESAYAYEVLARTLHRTLIDMRSRRWNDG